MTNVSLRAMSGSGERPVILGMVADGPHTLVARAVGPSLTSLGVADALSDPFITVFDARSRPVGQTDILLVDGLAHNLGAFELIEDSTEASLLVDLRPNEPRTLQARGADHRSGNVLVEAYHYKHGSGRIRNISERAWIKGSDPVAIAGFVLSNADTFRILIRAAGPALAEFGVNQPCPDPSIRLFRLGETEPFASSDNWSEDGSPNELTEAVTLAGAFAFEASSRDAALLVTLGPGKYTAVAEGVDDSEGIVLVEIYDLSEEEN